jgi:hypothetical protein
MTGQAGNNGQDRGGAADGERRDAASGRRDAAGERRDAAGERRDAVSERRDAAGVQRDLADDLQRWLVRSGVRSMRRELSDQVRQAFHAHRPAEPADVWGTATTETPAELLATSGEAPECAWCPVCRAARRIRETGPGVGGQLAGAGDAVAAAVQEAFSAFESLLSARSRTGGGRGGFPADRFPADRFPADRFPAAGRPPREADADHEPDDRG